MYCMGIVKSENPHAIDDGCESTDKHSSFIVFIIDEGCVGEILRPGIFGKTSHKSTNYYDS